MCSQASTEATVGQFAASDGGTVSGKKLQPRDGKSASAIAEAMRSIISASPIGASTIKDSDLSRMKDIDKEQPLVPSSAIF